MTYAFNEKRHLHTLDGVALTGCTTVLSVVAKPALIQWAANMAVNHIRDSYQPLMPLDKWEEILEEAREAHCKRKTDAGTWGTEMHALIEKHIKGEKPIVPAGHFKAWENFLDWEKKNKIKFLESEKNIYSEKHWLGGIVDFVCEIDGDVWIGDIKTSGSGIYAEHFWQCAGYQLMLQEMGLYPNIKGYIILNLKENGKMLEKRSVSNGDNTKAFLSCLEIYRIKEKISNQII